MVIKLVAKHRIHLSPSKKGAEKKVVLPGAIFEVEDEEADRLIKLKAAVEHIVSRRADKAQGETDLLTQQQ